MATKVTIFSGFLGAGKTTLIKKLIEEGYQGEKLMLIENEFGEIGIDGGFLKDSGVEITEMNAGCICCTLVGDFGKALREAATTYAPDRILIEPSGVGKLSDVIRAVQGAAQDAGLVLDGSVTVVDAVKCKMYAKNFGEFFDDQIIHAGSIILSRTNGISAEKLDACLKLLREKNEKAAILTTPWDEISGTAIREAINGGHSLMEELMHEAEVCPVCGHHHDHDHDHEHEHHHDHDHDHCCDHDHEHEHHHDHDGHCCCGHDHHHADEVFQSFGRETARAYTEAELNAALDVLDEGTAGMVLRAKGIIPCAEGGWFHFDYVPGERDIRKGAADYTGRLCVIGAKLNEDTINKIFYL